MEPGAWKWVVSIWECAFCQVEVIKREYKDLDVLIGLRHHRGHHPHPPQSISSLRIGPCPWYGFSSSIVLKKPKSFIFKCLKVDVKYWALVSLLFVVHKTSCIYKTDPNQWGLLLFNFFLLKPSCSGFKNVLSVCFRLWCESPKSQALLSKVVLKNEQKNKDPVSNFLFCRC